MSGRATPKKQRPKVVLVMIVREEAAIIRERLEAVVGQIDGFVIVDTGSTDQTPEIVQNVMREHERPGAFYRRKWAGFADGRTATVAFAQKWAGEQGGEWWALLLDADTIFHAARSWRTALAGEGDPSRWIGCEVHHGSIRYSHPRLLKLDGTEWRWRGVLHEYLEIPAGALGKESGLIHVEHGGGGARERNPSKYEDDARALAAARAEILFDGEHPDRDLLPRYRFYEAQSWRDGGFPPAAEAAYVSRTQMGGFFQEVYLSWLNIGELRLASGELGGALEAWTRAWAVDPSRAEALVGLASICRAWESWWPAYLYGSKARVVAPGSGGMFADQTVGWKADFEVSVSAWYVGKLGEGARACERVLAAEGVPESVLDRTRANLELYVAAMGEGS